MSDKTTPGWLKRAREQSSTVPSRRHVEAVIRRAQKAGTPVTIEGIARAAQVDKQFIYRRPDLLAAIRAAQPPGLDDDDKLDRQHVLRISANLERLINELRGDTPLGQWIRQAAIERAARELGVEPGDLDGARRPAPRRRNYSDRQREE